ncbi:MAG: hypothetical protein OXI43_01315 [Candidatus Poribacteria bacterium]|nr:hypothetical protein [Candidatus Poribacteria bacterium]
MNRKRFLGIAALTIFVIAAAGFIYWQLSSVQQFKKEAAETEKLLEEMRKPVESQAQPADATGETGEATRISDNRKAEQVAAESQQADGSLPTGQQAGKFPDWHSLTPEQRQQIADQFYIQFGLEVPPRGYDYHWKEPGVPYVDANGNPVLRRLDEPLIEVEMGIGFAPTLEEFKRHKQLMDAWIAASGSGDVAEEARLQAEVEALEASAQRMRPLSAMSISTTAEQKSKARSLRKEKYNAALREYGLEHLINQVGY